METIVIKIKGVKLFVNQDGVDVQFTLEKPIRGFRQNEDKTFTETDVKTISIPRKKLTAQLCEASDEIAMYRATLEHPFGQREFGIITFNAQLTVTRTRVSAGELIGEGDSAVAADRDKYLTDVIKVKLSEKALDQLDKATSL